MSLRRALVVASLLLALLGFGASPDAVRLSPAKPRTTQLPAALFVHGEHRSFPCYACHPGLFSTPRARPTHAEMKAGGYCGACHDGRAARSVAQLGCRSCHAR